jgi:hypothetical protein
MNPLEYLENHPEVFYGVFVFIVISNGLFFYFGGRTAEKRFQGQGRQRVVFRERGVSGHSKASLRTRWSGASRVLEVVVTDNELWIKGIWPMFSYIGSKHDLTHRISRSSVTKVHATNGKVEVWFTNEQGNESHVELRLKDAAAFQRALSGREDR